MESLKNIQVETVETAKEQKMNPIITAMNEWKLLPFFSGDKTIWTIVLLLTLFSALSVYSSTGMLAYKYNHATSHYLFKHSLLILLGVALMWICHKIPFSYFSGMSKIFLYASIVCLVYTILFVKETNDAKRWIALPIINLTFQASDLAKLALIMYISRTLSIRQETIKDFYQGFVPIFIPICVVCILIFPENLSTSLVLFTTSMLLMFIGRVSIKHLAAICIGFIGILGIFIFVIFKMPEENLMGRMATWKHRIESYSNKNEQQPYQVIQANIAIAKGGIFPNGPGNSIQKNFLPHPYSDYIYAIIIEEWGLLGGGFVLFLYILFLWRCIRIVIKTPKAFGALVAVGLGISIVIQAMINMGVAVGLLPVTGMTLPLVSMGGSSLLFMGIAFGIILSVSRSVEQELLINKEEIN